MKVFLLLFLIVGCGKDSHVKVDSSEHVFRIENPIIEFCEKLHPVSMYSTYSQRELAIADCLEICTESNACSVGFPTSTTGF